MTVALTSQEPSEGSLSQSSLTFTSANWNVPQTVTVTGLNDGLNSGSHTYQITGSATANPGPGGNGANYNNVVLSPITVINREGGVPALVASSTELVSEDNNVLLVNSLTGAVIATIATGVANDGAAIGPDGSIYVGDYNNDQILHYTVNGILLGSFPTGIAPQGLTFGPNGDLYVTTTSSTVEEYTPTGSYVGLFITAGSGGLNNAKDIVWGPDGNAYVLSFYNSEVIEYNGTTGQYLKVFALGGDGFEQIAFGPDGDLMVASYGNNTVYCFSGTTGAILNTITVTAPFGLQFNAGRSRSFKPFLGPDSNVHAFWNLARYAGFGLDESRIHQNDRFPGNE